MYTELHHAYLKIVEDVLEAQVKERYDVNDEELEGFYSSIKEDQLKIKQLEAIDKQIMEHLFAFCDFNVFKNNMLEVKKANNEGKNGMIDNKQTV